MDPQAKLAAFVAQAKEERKAAAILTKALREVATPLKGPRLTLRAAFERMLDSQKRAQLVAALDKRIATLTEVRDRIQEDGL